MTLEVAITRLPHGATVDLPHYATEEAAGMDLQAAIEVPLVLGPGKRVLVPTGLAIALPTGYEAQIRPRSGLAAKHGVTILNSPGTIDSDYRGEIKVLLVNLGEETFVIEPQIRIAQMIITCHTRICWRITEVLSETVRGEGGFGSTGTGK